ncbi:MAG: hypothetical protein IPF56_10930 [Chloroflexi bacterium]|nr:hypothetical protein [Chloroflexota bacterium]
MHRGTMALVDQLDFVVASAKFGLEYGGAPDAEATRFPTWRGWRERPVITLGETWIESQGKGCGDGQIIGVCGDDHRCTAPATLSTERLTYGLAAGFLAGSTAVCQCGGGVVLRHNRRAGWRLPSGTARGRLSPASTNP